MQTRPPQVDKLLRHPKLQACQDVYQHFVLVKVVRTILTRARNEAAGFDEDDLAEAVVKELADLAAPSLKKVINGTGVVLNTNLGRSPISAAYLDALKDVASGYCNLEYDLMAGKRGKRSGSIQKLLQILTGAEAGLAVNNNAAALVLAVNCLALGKDVLVSRGELIEIGGSFRLTDVIESGGANLKEVGTTNKTRLADFEKAFSDKTGLLMRCHRSNFEIKGFTEQPSLIELVKLCQRLNIPFVEDLGSGALVNMSNYGLDEEPTVEDAVQAGCDIITFSGDKLLGGPQAGLIVGKKVFIEKLAAHPLYRALRLDKVSIFLLEQSLKAYTMAHPETHLTSLAFMAADASHIKNRIEKFIAGALTRLNSIGLKVVATNSAIGGGSMPGKEKASFALSVACAKLTSSELAKRLRQLDTPIISLMRENEVLIDFRTVQDSEEAMILEGLCRLEKECD